MYQSYKIRRDSGFVQQIAKPDNPRSFAVCTLPNVSLHITVLIKICKGCGLARRSTAKINYRYIE
jgi:hypothetical protein